MQHFLAVVTGVLIDTPYHEQIKNTWAAGAGWRIEITYAGGVVDQAGV